MTIDLNLEIEENIENIMKINKSSITAIIVDSSDYEDYITAYDNGWTECCKLFTNLYENFQNYFDKYTETDLVRKSGYDVGSNNLDSILTMSKHIDKTNLLDVVFSGDYDSSDKYALYGKNTSGFFTANDLGDFIDYEQITRLLSDEEFSKLNKQYEEVKKEVRKYI